MTRSERKAAAQRFLRAKAGNRQEPAGWMKRCAAAILQPPYHTTVEHCLAVAAECRREGHYSYGRTMVRQARTIRTWRWL
jgi:hypothetical protein